jgi:hypothetical protein
MARGLDPRAGKPASGQVSRSQRSEGRAVLRVEF